MSSFNLLNLGTQALRANQTALSTVGQNINNVNTPGYTRQSVTFNSIEGRSGVLIESIDRITDRFLTDQLWTDLSAYNQTTAYTQLSSELDDLLASQPTSVSNALDNYFSAMQNVVDDPVSVPNRELFVAEANALVERFNDLDRYVRRQNTTINEKIDDLASQVTTKAHSIAELNNKIRIATAAGNPTNELKDQREELTNQLSELVGIKVVEQGEEFSIFVGNGQPLVVGQSANPMVSLQGGLDASQNDLALIIAGNTVRVTDELKGGELGGILTYREEALNNALDELGLMAIGLAQSMNEQHQAGIDLNNQFGEIIFGDMNASHLQQSRISSGPDNESTVTRATVEIQDIGQLKPTDYELVYENDEQITLVRKSDGALIDLGQFTNVMTNRTVDANPISWGGNVGPVVDADGSGVVSETMTATLNTVAGAATPVNSAQGMAEYLNSIPGVSGVEAESAINITTVTEFFDGVGAPADGVSFDLKINDATGTEQTVTINLASQQTTPVSLLAPAQYTDASVLSTINAALAGSGYDFTNLDVSIADGGIKILDNTGGNIQLDASGGAEADTIGIQNYSANGSLIGGGEVTITANDVNNDTGTIVGYLNESTATVDSSVETLDIATGGGTTLIGSAAVTLIDASNNVASTQTNTVAGIAEVDQGEIYLDENSGTLAFAIDGFKVTIDTDRGFVSGDRFLIQPVRNGGEDLSLVIQDGRELALASPVRITPQEENSGTGVVTARVLDPDGVAFDNVPGELKPPIDIVFNNGEPLTYTAYDMTNPSNPQVLDLGEGLVRNEAYVAGQEIVFNGYSVTISNQPESGDRFSFRFNKDGVSDNRNALEISNLQQKDLLSEGSYQDLYGSLVERVGTRTATSIITENANKAVLDATVTAKSSVAGVNLDEEAAKLVQFQQAYQASAQLISTSQTLFDTLLNSI